MFKKLITAGMAFVMVSCNHLPTQDAKQVETHKNSDENLSFSKSYNPDRYPAGLDSGYKYDLRRGSPADYDPGAPKDSEWMALYSMAPNYRSVGEEILNGGEEKFRWIFGPMWYRGRLGKNQVKAFVVGQEGAQDENISNRAFTGSTGTKTQKFLNHLGIYRSYLFMNTFVYTINGQLDPENPKFKWMEQGETSPIVEYRHKLFDNMVRQNPDTVSLLMGVGEGGKASLTTWLNARGANCIAWKLNECDANKIKKYFEAKGIKIKNTLVAIGVPHPGGANPNLGGEEQLQKIIQGFTNAARRVGQFKINNPDWLPSDEDEKLTGEAFTNRLMSDYKYGNAPVPFRDFAFGTNWRMGKSGTSSNRWGSDAIQIFSDEGEYNGKESKYGYLRDEDSGFVKNDYGYVVGLKGMKEQDFAYEPPKFDGSDLDHVAQYDYGPCGFVEAYGKPCDLAKLLTAWPNFDELGVTKPISHSSFGYAGIYRGRLNDAQLLVIADQESHDDMFSGRAWTGLQGQKLQSYLNATGVGSSYAILRTLPVDTLGLPKNDLLQLVTNEQVVLARERILQEVLKSGKTKVIVTIGDGAKEALKKYKEKNSLQNISIVQLDMPNSFGATEMWNSTVTGVAKNLGVQVAGEYTGQPMTISRIDLPYHSRWWMGSSGDRALRGENIDVGHYYRVWAPTWVKKLRAKDLAQEEKNQILNKMQEASLVP